jgi:benzoate transport
MIAGSLLLGPMADRFGRRPLVLACLVLISLGMLLSAATQNMEQLLATRVLTGLGIGGMLPSLNTIVSEYSSLRWRSFAVTFLQAGYPLGATLGGMGAAILIGSHGWRSVYLAAGFVSTLLIVVVWRRLPESLDYLMIHSRNRTVGEVNRLLGRLGQPAIETLPVSGTGNAPQKTGYADLLANPGLLRTTALLCVTFMTVMLSFYFVLSWTPKLLVDAGMSVSQGISGGVLLNVGGIAGSMLLGYMSSRLAIRKLIAVYMLLTAGLMVLFSGVTTFDSATLSLTLLLGFFIFGSIVGLYALAPHLYPPGSRTAGLGIAIGIGRIGGVLSPVLAGVLFDAGWGRQDSYLVFALPLVLCALVVLAIRSKK